MSDTSLPNRLRAGSKGLGAASATEIEQRAGELAKIDGRTEVTDIDLDQAATELDGFSGSLPLPETTNPDVAHLTAWDDPVDAEGQHTPTSKLDDELNVAEQLIEDGIREADHDSRVAAAEEADERER
jgi:hypothetical protein